MARGDELDVEGTCAFPFRALFATTSDQVLACELQRRLMQTEGISDFSVS